MFKSIIFSKVVKHVLNCSKGKGYRRKMTVLVERTWLVCDKVITLPDFSCIRKYNRFLALEKNWQGS